MRPFEIFRAMPSERAVDFFRALADTSPPAWAQCLGLAAAALRARPVFLRRRPFERQAEAVRRALARPAASDVGEEMLAIFFLECRRPLLVEWLDATGVAHQDGVLQDETVPEPEPEALRAAFAKFVAGGGDGAEDAAAFERRLLLTAFGAQSSVDWPTLDALLAEH